MSFVDDLIDKCNDLNRRLSFIERLDVNPPVTSVPKYSGTPVAGQLAIWSGAGTVFGTATYGTATIGVLANANTWAGVNTWTDVQQLYAGVSNEYTTEQVIDIANVTRLQQITFDLTTASSSGVFHTDFAITMHLDSTPTVYAIASGFINYKGTGGSTYVITDYDITYDCSGTESFSVTTITGGVRITLDSSDFLNTLNANIAWFKTTGYRSQNITITVTIT